MEEKKIEEKIKKEKKQEIVKKEKAEINGKDLGISTKHSAAICDFIRKKKIKDAIQMLEEVIIKKRAIPMKGEHPHKKGIRGGGRYPVKSTKIFIKLLKSLNANSNVNGIEEPFVDVAIANQASRPYKRFGSQKFKRTHVYLSAKEYTKPENIKNKEKKK